MGICGIPLLGHTPFPLVTKNIHIFATPHCQAASYPKCALCDNKATKHKPRAIRWKLQTPNGEILVCSSCHFHCKTSLDAALAEDESDGDSGAESDDDALFGDDIDDAGDLQDEEDVQFEPQGIFIRLRFMQSSYSSFVRRSSHPPCRTATIHC